MARPEGNMTQGFALGFCVSYTQFISRRWRVWDDKEDMFMNDEVFEGNGRNHITFATF